MFCWSANINNEKSCSSLSHTLTSNLRKASFNAPTLVSGEKGGQGLGQFGGDQNSEQTLPFAQSSLEISSNNNLNSTIATIAADRDHAISQYQINQ